MQLSQNGSITDAQATREAAIAKQEGHCQFCSLSGQVTIFHKNYAGLPTMIIADHNGEEREVMACIVAHCSCEVGKWMRRYTPSEILGRIPGLSELGRGAYKNWTPVDPRESDCDLTEIPDWKSFRRWLASTGRNGVVKKVYPQYEGNRTQARREMGAEQTVPF